MIFDYTTKCRKSQISSRLCRNKCNIDRRNIISNRRNVTTTGGTLPATGGTSPAAAHSDATATGWTTQICRNICISEADTSVSSLWLNSWTVEGLLRFKTFVSANSVSDDKLALVFLTNQTSDTYKLINNYASQQDTPTTADNMQFSDIAEFMSMQHYDPTKFTVRERDTSSGAA